MLNLQLLLLCTVILTGCATTPVSPTQHLTNIGIFWENMGLEIDADDAKERRDLKIKNTLLRQDIDYYNAGWKCTTTEGVVRCYITQRVRHRATDEL